MKVKKIYKKAQDESRGFLWPLIILGLIGFAAYILFKIAKKILGIA